MHIKGVVLLLAVTLLGCAAEEDVDCGGAFRIAEGFTPQQVDHINAAAAGWNAFAGKQVVELREEARCEIVLSDELSVPSRSAEYVRASGQILIRPVFPYSDDAVAYMHLVMHEMGHALHLRHVPGPALMAESRGDVSYTFTASDLAECRRAGVCDKE